jgi:Uri superfamily endonuclease
MIAPIIRLRPGSVHGPEPADGNSKQNMQATIPGSADSPNRQLYLAGQRFLRALKQPAQGKYTTAELQPIALDYATSVAELRTAVEFVQAVNQIAAVAGAKAKQLILSGENVLLTPALIGQLRRCPPERLKIALRQAASGLHPCARPVPEGTPPEFAPWDHDLYRLRQARHLLERSQSVAIQSLSLDQRPVLYRDATATRVAAAAIAVALQHWTGRKERPRPTVALTRGPEQNLLAGTRKARLLVEAVTHDLPLAISRHCPSPKPLQQLQAATATVYGLAARLAAGTRPVANGRSSRAAALLSEQAEGPDARPGTYVMVLQAEQPAILRIGRLETFWLPAGFFLYVGSAFAPNLVQRRIARHRSTEATLRWNLDHIKTIARPIELWWTHHAEKVECRWAMALAELPGCCCPAPGCGANDCKNCPAHFYWTGKRPSCQAFAEVVGQAIADHGPICCQRLG